MARSKKKSPGRGFKHGGYSLMVRRGELPEKMTRIRKYLTEVRAGLVRDIAGQEESLTTAQLVLIDRAISLLSVLRTIESSLSERGILQGKGKDLELQSILQNNYLAYSNSLRLILRELGVDRRTSGPELDLQAYLRAKDAAAKEPKGEGHEGGENERLANVKTQTR